MSARRIGKLVAAVALIVAVALVSLRGGDEVAPAPTATPTHSAEPGPRLPPEVYTTLERIAAGGPFPYRQDGVVFRNRERILPTRADGYYHEYTVETPGSPDRGARRIVTGGDPPTEYFYSDDHYRSFRRIDGPKAPR